MRKLSPLCLVLALLTLIAGFTVVAVPEPEVDMELHRARARGDEAYEQVLEERLERRRWKRRLLMGGLFVTSGLLAVAAYTTLGSDRSRS